MNREELVQKLQQIYGSEELEQIKEVASQIPKQALSPVHEIIKGHEAPPGINGIPADGEYKEDTKTLLLYGEDFKPKVLFHEIGHCIYHECPEITEVTDSEYRNSLHELETVGEGLSWEKGAAEFCANAYQLYKTGTISTDERRERFQDLANKLGKRGF